MMRTIPIYFLAVLFLFSACLKEVEPTTASQFDLDNLEESLFLRNEALDSLMKYKPNDPEAFYLRSIGQFRNGDLAEGLSNLTRAAELDPKLYLNYLGFIKMLYLRDYEGAEKDFEKSLELNVKEDIIIAGSTYMRLGIVKLVLGKHQEAVDYFEKDVKHFGKKNVMTYSFVYSGIAKHRLGDYEGAILEFDEALAQWNKCPEAYYHKGKTLVQQGKKEAACKQFKKALLHKDFRWSNPWRTYIEQLYEADIEEMFDKTCR